MSYNDPTHWRGRAKELRGLADEMHESVSKQLMRKMADDYDHLARTAERRAREAPPKPFPNIDVLPAEVRQFARRKLVRLSRTSISEIPGFLKRGPARADEVGAPVAFAEIWESVAAKERERD